MNALNKRYFKFLGFGKKEKVCWEGRWVGSIKRKLTCFLSPIYWVGWQMKELEFFQTKSSNFLIPHSFMVLLTRNLDSSFWSFQLVQFDSNGTFHTYYLFAAIYFFWFLNSTHLAFKVIDLLSHSTYRFFIIFPQNPIPYGTV